MGRRGHVQSRARHPRREGQDAPRATAAKPTRLHAVLQMRRTGADGVDLGPKAYVFGDATGQRVTSIRTAWEAARERAGLADLHLADLRHEAASRLENVGVPTTYVSKFLGHRNLSTTTRYLNATIRGLRLAVEKLEESRRKAHRSTWGLEPPRCCYRQPLNLEDVVTVDGRPQKTGVGCHASWPTVAHGERASCVACKFLHTGCD